MQNINNVNSTGAKDRSARGTIFRHLGRAAQMAKVSQRRTDVSIANEYQAIA
jgi:hypothetical protein